MKDEIIELVEQLDLPKGQYCLFGGSSLAIRNIRPTYDIDLYVTQKLYGELKKQGWEEIKLDNFMPYLYKKFSKFECEAFTTYNKNDRWIPKIKDYIESPEVVEGIPFMPLKELYDWKADTARFKDLADNKLIEAYWAKQQ